MSQFDELLAQLNAVQEEQSTLAKAMPEADGEDDKAIQTAAEDGAEDNGNPEDEDNGEEPMTKSIMIDGEAHDVVDAEVLIKSIHDQGERLGQAEEVLAKGLTAALGMIKGQGELIKSMQGQIAKLSKQGTGRKTVLSVHEKPVVSGEPLAKSQQEGLTPAELMAKANAAYDAKKISGQELTAIDVALRQGIAPETGLLAKCLQ